MSRRALPDGPVTLTSVQKEFEHWRRTRRHPRPIPEELWAAAVRLTREHSVRQVSKALRLNYTQLRERARAAEPGGPGECVSNSGFIEVRPPPPGIAAGEWVLELDEPGGGRLKMSVKGKPEVDVLEVVRAVLGWAR